MNFLLFAIFICCASIDCSVTNNTEDRLLFAQIIFRHGDRAIRKSYPNDPYKNEIHWPEGYAQLTNLGKQQAYDLGKFFGRRYEKLLGDGSYSPNKIFTVSSDRDRTIMSGTLVLAGLFPPKNDQVWNKNLLWQPIPVHIIPLKDDYLIHPNENCSLYQRAYQEFQRSPAVQALNERSRELFWYLEQNTGGPVRNLLHVKDLYSTLLTEQKRNKTLPEWTKTVFFPGSEMQRIAEYWMGSVSETTTMKRFRSGFLLKEILNHFHSKSTLNLKPNRLLWLYSGHDTTIADMLNTLGVFETHRPPHASSILFEMYESNDGFNLKIFYRNTTEEHLVPLKLPNCGTKCPLHQFFDLYKDVLPTSDFEKECQLPDD